MKPIQELSATDLQQRAPLKRQIKEFARLKVSGGIRKDCSRSPLTEQKSPISPSLTEDGT